MSTQNHEVFYNNSTPMFLQSGANAVNTAPLTLVSTPTPATRQTTITCTPTGGGGIYYAPIGSSDTQAYGYLRFGNGGGWELLTNNVSQLFGYSGNIGANVPITISSPQSSSSVEITATTIGKPSTPASTITFAPTSINIGQGVVASDGTGLLVQNSSGTSVSVHTPTSTAFATITQTPSTTTYTFSAETLPAQGYTQSSSVEGFSITCDIPAFTNGGATYTNPSLSAVAVTNTGTPPSSGKALYMGTTTGTPNYVGNGYIEFPPIYSTAGTLIQVQWKQAGTYTYGKLVKNDVVFADLLSLSGSSWSSSGAYSFTSSGDDRLYIQINNFAATPSVSTIYYNISDIAIISYTPSTVTNGVVGMNGSTIQMSNSSGSRVEARSSDGAAALYSSTGTGSSIVAASDITLSSTTSITLNAGQTNANGLLNMNANQISNIGTATATYLVGTSNVSTPALDNPTSTLTIGSGSSSVTLNRASNVYTAALDGFGSGLLVGYTSPSNSVGVYNVNVLSGSLTSGGGTGFNISNCKMLNLSPACPPAVLFYTGNFGAYRQLSTTLLPGIAVRMTSVFPSDYVPDNFTSADYITIPAYSVFTLSGTINFTQSNTNSIPQIYSLSGHSFSPTDGSQRYSLQPILV